MRVRAAVGLAVLVLAGAARAATAGGDGVPSVRTHQDAAPVPAHLRSGLRTLLTGHGPRITVGVRIGRSAGGRPIVATASGDPDAAERVLVVGCIHGTECAGMAVARQVLRGPRECPPYDADIWSLPDLDPDGRATGSRLNGHGVDLNRNFRAGWRPIGLPGEYSGRRPFSEPETRTARAVVRALRPRLTVWFHQQAEALVRAWGPSVPAARRYARLVGLPFRRMRWPAGTAPHWQNTTFGGTASFVVELAPGPLSRAAARLHAHAIQVLAGVA